MTPGASAGRPGAQRRAQLGMQAFMFVVVLLTNELWLHGWQLSRFLDVSLDAPREACVLTSLAAAQTWRLTEPGFWDPQGS